MHEDTTDLTEKLAAVDGIPTKSVLAVPPGADTAQLWCMGTRILLDVVDGGTARHGYREV